MKFLGSLSIILLVASPVVAQHGGVSGGGRGAGGARGGIGGRQSGPGFSRGRFTRGVNQRFRTGFFGDFYPYGSPWFGDDYDYGYPYDFEYPQEPPMPIERPLPPPAIVQQAPPPVPRPVTHEYVSPAPTAPTGMEPTFVIALRDGSQMAATAVWVQDGTVHYLDSEDRAHQTPLTSVDRNLTRRLNQEKNLDLRLPFQ